MKSFLTGSCAYGTPNADSDIDLVICISPEDLGLLIEQSDDGSCRYGGDVLCACLRFGKLNILACTRDEDFAVWKVGVAHLKLRAPVVREQAVGTFKFLRSLLTAEPNQAKIGHDAPAALLEVA
jgi:hypothetical protein